MSAVWSLSRVKRTSRGQPISVEIDPSRPSLARFCYDAHNIPHAGLLRCARKDGESNTLWLAFPPR